MTTMNEVKDGNTQNKSTYQPPTALPEKTPGQPYYNHPTEHAGSIRVHSQILKAPRIKENDGAVSPQQKTVVSLDSDVNWSDRVIKIRYCRSAKEGNENKISRHPVQSAEEHAAFRQRTPGPEEAKLIILSRILAGLIDLTIIFLCTAVFIISADYFSGIVIVDAVSLYEGAGLFLLVFLLYSIFFMAATGQTVGMMITDLRVVSMQGGHPSMGQFFKRCFGYFLSVIVFGAGLLWILFDRNKRCFHDRFSNTSIIRI